MDIEILNKRRIDLINEVKQLGVVHGKLIGQIAEIEHWIVELAKTIQMEKTDVETNNKESGQASEK